jgi:leucyl aminopeptidase
MNVKVIASDPLSHPTPLLVLPVPKGATEPEGVFSGVDELVGGALRRALTEGDFTGKAEETLLLYPAKESGPGRILVIGLGEEESLDAEVLRGAAGRSVRVAEGLKVSALAVWLDAAWGMGSFVSAQAVTEGCVLAGWRFLELKSEEDPEKVGPEVTDLTLIADGNGAGEASEGARVGRAQARGENFARTLQSRPGNVATPSHLAREAEAMGKELGLKVTILGPKEMEAEGMGALLAVAQGSEEEPRLIVLKHDGGEESDPPLVLVGKGLTFDAGGISIKPAAGMEDMKFDMSGGAAVLGAMFAIGELGLPMNVVGIVPSSENLLSGNAVKPGDVVRTREGKTVEILNTDAEGRLILSDALSYAQTFQPAAMVDCATLTGACVIALGNHASAILGTDEDLIQELRDAGDRSGERCWPLPLWKEYREQLDSTVADLKNIGGRPAGTITASAFLREFVGDVPWAHLDIAGTAYGEGKRSYHRKGGYGVPTRLLVEWVRGRLG